MSNRAERRRQGRSDKPAVYMYTQDQIDKMIQDAVAKELAGIREKAVDTATRTAFQMFMSIPAMVLHDKFGFGRIRTNRFMDYVMIWYESIQTGETSLKEIMKIAEDATGVRVNRDSIPDRK
jgi:hypothetical protein